MMRPNTRFESRLAWQQPDLVSSAPPRSLLPEIEKMKKRLIGRDNMDKTYSEFLLHAGTELQQHVIGNLKAYEATLTYIGWVAGVVGTEQQQETARAQLKEAVSAYAGSVLDRSPRDDWYDHWKPGNIVATAVGAVYKASGAAAGLAGFDETAKDWDSTGKRALNTDWHVALDTVVADWVNSIIQSLKDYWDWFWEEYDKNGLLIAVGKAKIDLAFLGAEIALDIAIGALTGGAGAVVSFVAKRVAVGVTRITIRAASKTARAVARVDGPGGLVRDSDIPAEINKLVDEDKLGGGAPLDDTKARTEAKPETSETTTVKGSTKPLREQYLGDTPGKGSATGRKVIDRMRREGKFRDGPPPKFMASDHKWYDLDLADMSHKTDAVSYWNSTGRYFGAKSPTVRKWMLDPDNYVLDHKSINRADGGRLKERYLPPIDPADPSFRGPN